MPRQRSYTSFRTAAAVVVKALQSGQDEKLREVNRNCLPESRPGRWCIQPDLSVKYLSRENETLSEICLGTSLSVSDVVKANALGKDLKLAECTIVSMSFSMVLQEGQDVAIKAPIIPRKRRKEAKKKTDAVKSTSRQRGKGETKQKKLRGDKILKRGSSDSDTASSVKGRRGKPKKKDTLQGRTSRRKVAQRASVRSTRHTGKPRPDYREKEMDDFGTDESSDEDDDDDDDDDSNHEDGNDDDDDDDDDEDDDDDDDDESFSAGRETETETESEDDNSWIAEHLIVHRVLQKRLRTRTEWRKIMDPIHTRHVHRGSVFASEEDYVRQRMEDATPSNGDVTSETSVNQTEPNLHVEQGSEMQDLEQRVLIKWKGLSYLHVSWEKIEDIEQFCNDLSYRKVLSFCKPESSESSDEEEGKGIHDSEDGDESFGVEGVSSVPERIVASKIDDEVEVDNPPCYVCHQRYKNGDVDLRCSDHNCPYSAHAQCILKTRTSGEISQPWFCDTCAEIRRYKSEGKLDSMPIRLFFHNKLMLVKWRLLSYDECTWETPEDLPDEDLMQAYHKTLGKNSAERLENCLRFSARPGATVMNNALAAYHANTGFLNENSLRSYQLQGVKWMMFNWFNRRNSLLADEMGLGKTVQIVGLTNGLKSMLKVFDPVLIVVPLSTIDHWLQEFKRWTSLDCIVLHGNREARKIFFEHEWQRPRPPSQQKPLRGAQVRQLAFKFDVVITTFETVGAPDVFSHLKRVKWSLLVVDEAHRLKSIKSKLGAQLRAIKWDSCVLLTGTPIQNSMGELWALLNFIDGKEFPSMQSFLNKFGSPDTVAELTLLHNRIKMYFLRRLKDDVEKIPPREETLIFVELTVTQKQQYRAIYERNRSFLVNKGAKAPRLLNISMQLRKCCNHPYLIRGAEEKILHDHADANVGEMLVKSSAKLILLDKLLPKLRDDGHRVLLFSQMTRLLDILEDFLRLRNFSYSRIDGGTTGNARQKVINEYNEGGPSAPFIMMLSTRAGGVGINLTSSMSSNWPE
eukprot:g4235.t1